MSLEPTPTPLDARVLAALPRDRPGLRAHDVAKRLEPKYGPPPPTLDRDVRLILRGLEHLGHTTGTGGWWRRLERP